LLPAAIRWRRSRNHRRHPFAREVYNETLVQVDE
jgi:hypothetical protein